MIDRWLFPQFLNWLVLVDQVQGKESTCDFGPHIADVSCSFMHRYCVNIINWGHFWQPMVFPCLTLLLLLLVWQYILHHVCYISRWEQQSNFDHHLMVCIFFQGKQCCGKCRCPQITQFMGPSWGPPGSCWPQMGPMLAPRTMLSGFLCMAQ